MKHLKPYRIYERREEPELFGEKPEHIQIVDAFEKFNDKTKFSGKFISDNNYKQYIDKNIDKAISILQNSDEKDVFDFLYPFLKTNDPDTNPKFYNKKWFKDNNAEFSFKGLNGQVDYDTIVDDLLSATGIKAYHKFIPTEVENVLSENEFIDTLKKTSSDGLSIYRTIKYRYDKKDKQNGYADLYDKVTKEYTGAGYYWTFKEHNAEAYNGSSGNDYTVYAKVRLADINWVQTIFKNMYSLRHEKEIEINSDAIIKIEKILSMKDDKFINFEEPLYVKA